MRKIFLIAMVFLAACKKDQPNKDTAHTIVGVWHSYQKGEKYYFDQKQVFEYPLDAIPATSNDNTSFEFTESGLLTNSTAATFNGTYSLNNDTLTVHDGGAVFKYAAVFIDANTLSLTQATTYSPPTKFGFTNNGTTTEVTVDLLRTTFIYKKK